MTKGALKKPTATDWSRVMVVGTSGSGKTTFAGRLADKFGHPHIELDELHFEPGWVERSDEDFRRDVSTATDAECWVSCGNYGVVRDLTWGRASTLIWLNYPRRVVFWRVLRRTVRRSLTGQIICNGNRESWRKSFFSRDSILIWSMGTFARRRRQYPSLMRKPEFRHLSIYELHHPCEAERLLANLKPRLP